MGSLPEPAPRRKRLRDDDDDAMDPVYQRFFDHLRVDGKSYVLEFSPSSLKYEREEDSAREDLGNSRGSGLFPRSSMADESYRVFLDNLRVNGDSMTLELEDGLVVYEFGGGGMGREEQEQQREFSVPCAPLVDESPFVDKDYGMFLGCAETCGHAMVVKLPDGVTLEYEGGGGGEEEELPNETEDLVNDSSTHAIETDFSAQSSRDSGSEHEGSLDGNVNYRLSSFEDRLREHLVRPFSQREYDKLKKLATTQKPKVKWRHLRCFDIPYETNDFGPSYFGYYRDLAEQVESADHYRGLELLRGFFFWIENVGHEGAYKPWVSRRSDCKNYHAC